MGPSLEAEKGKKKDIWTQTHGPMEGEGRVEVETETPCLHGQAKAHQGLWTPGSPIPGILQARSLE